MDDGHNDAPFLKVATKIEDLDGDEIEAYWRKLEMTLREVFGKDDAEPLVEAYRRRLKGLNANGALLAYHIDPLQVAADLAERAFVTTDDKIAYSTKVLASEMLAEELPTDAALSYRVREDGLPARKSGTTAP